MVAELYGAESKPQVYGALHTFLQENKEEMANLHMLHSVIHKVAQPQTRGGRTCRDVTSKVTC